MDTITDETKRYIIEQIALLEDEKDRKYIRNYLRAHINSILRGIFYQDYALYEHYGNFSILIHKELKRLRML